MEYTLENLGGIIVFKGLTCFILWGVVLALLIKNEIKDANKRNKIYDKMVKRLEELDEK